MKTIMHPDYWVEIPAGECIIGLSLEQREKIWEYVLQIANYDRRTPTDKMKMQAVVEKWRRRESTKEAEEEVFGLHWDLMRTAGLRGCLPQQTIWLERFYIARFPITAAQVRMFGWHEDSSAKELPGALDTPQFGRREDGSPYYLRCKGEAQNSVYEMRRQLGARFPTSDEWEKAARGTDGRLYPWGDEWNPNAGYFYREQKYPRTCGEGATEVDAHPEGVSPYGVWDMLGGLAELKFTMKGLITPNTDGWSPRDSSPEAAPLHYLAANRGDSGEQRPVAYRPVLDEWPVQQWQGVELDGSEK